MPDPVSIDAAWAEAEAALPEGWRIIDVRRHFRDPNAGLWAASAASLDLDEKGGGEFEYTASETGTGYTPAEALNDLATELSKKRPAPHP